MNKRIKATIIGILLISMICIVVLISSWKSSAAEPEDKNSLGNIAAIYDAIAVFDTNKNKTIDDEENEALKKAISDETLKLPDQPKPPLGMKPPASFLAGRLSKAYKSLSQYDKNQNHSLDQAEQKQLQKDLDSGKLKLPLPPATK